tara:strand:- start:85 stop:237 length:153 start_codon:yes stop_codon:yes gene_type:complete
MIKKIYGVRPINPVAKAMLQKRKSPMVIPNKKKQKPKKLDRRQIDNERDV